MVIKVTPNATVRVPSEDNSLNSLTLATWNILGDQYDRQKRLLHASAELYDIDILAVQEAVQPIDGSPDTATELARLGGMQVASFILAGAVNSVSKDQMASAILTRLEIVESNIKITAPAEETDSAIGEHKQYAAALLKTKTGRLVLMVSVHLPWGGQKEYRRLKHAESINAQIESIMNNLPKGSIAVLAGDFNAPPSADTLRYLRGESGLPHHSAFWVDAWDEKGDGPCHTNDPASGNSNLERTARASGIPSPAMLPSRRIDYLLLRGWVYGSAGAPLQASLFGNRKDANGLHASDHFGIKVRVWDPEVS